MVNHVRKSTRVVRVHRRLAVAVPRLRDGRAAAARCGLHRSWSKPVNGRRRGGSSSCAPVRWSPGTATARRRLRSASSAPTPTAPTCGSNSIPTASYPAGRSSPWQPYGGAWLNSWLDRDLGVSGRLSVRSSGGAIEDRLVRIDEPILRVPQLAIHLAEDRKAVSLDPQRHVNAVWGVGSGPRSFLGYVAEQAGVDADDDPRIRPDDPRPDPVVACRAQAVSWSARRDWTTSATCYAGLEAFLAARAERATCRCSPCSTTRRSARSRITARSPSCC